MMGRSGYNLVVAAAVGLLLLVEFVMVWVSPALGVLGYAVSFVFILVFVTIQHHEPLKPVLYSLSFIPLLRLISLSLPYNILPTYTWNLLQGLVLSTAIVPFRFLYRPPSSHQNRQWFAALIIVVAAIDFGIWRYLILQPDAILVESPQQTALLVVGIFLFSGVLEGYLFHGIIQASLRALVSQGMTILAMILLVAGLQVGFGSWPYTVLIMVQTLFFSLFAASNLNFPISIAYGIIAITSLVILPAVS